MDLCVCTFAGLCLAISPLAATAQVDPTGGAGQVVTLRPYVMVGQPLPGTGNVREILSFDCSERCYTGFRVNAFLPGTAVSRDHLFVGFGPGRQMIARGGNPAPGGFVYSDVHDTFNALGIGEVGLLNSFSAALRTPGGEAAGTGIIGPGPSGPRILLRTGTHAPDLPDATMITGLVPGMAVDNSGQPVMRVTLSGGGIAGLALYQARHEGARLFARSGDPAPGIPGSALSIGDGAPPLAADGGVIVFQGAYTGGQTGSAIWRGTGRESIAPVAVSGRPAPGAGEGVNYGPISFTVNLGAALGQVSYVASLAGRNVTDLNDTALFSGPFAHPTMRVREDQHAPRMGEGVTFAAFEHQAINSDGTLVFEARLRGPTVTAANDSSLWRLAGGELVPLAREGDLVPGTAGEFRFGQLSRGAVEAFYLNSRGDVVFEGVLRGAGGAERGRALFAAAADGEVTMLVRTGQSIEVNGAHVTVNEIVTNALTALTANGGNSTGGADGRRTILNRHGEVFMLLRTSGGAGLFKAQVGVRPCPADFNRDDFIDCFDYFDFIEAFEAGRPEADFNEDGFIDFLDFTDFVTAFEEGC